MIPYHLRRKLKAFDKNSSVIRVILSNDREISGTYIGDDENQIHIRIGDVVCSYFWEGVRDILAP